MNVDLMALSLSELLAYVRKLEAANRAMRLEIIRLSPTGEADAQSFPFTKDDKALLLERIQGPEQFMQDNARTLGFEGDTCEACGAMMMVRNGSCLKCQSCGTTTGCS